MKSSFLKGTTCERVVDFCVLSETNPLPYSKCISRIFSKHVLLHDLVGSVYAEHNSVLFRVRDDCACNVWPLFILFGFHKEFWLPV